MSMVIHRLSKVDFETEVIVLRRHLTRIRWSK